MIYNQSFKSRTFIQNPQLPIDTQYYALLQKTKNLKELIKQGLNLRRLKRKWSTCSQRQKVKSSRTTNCSIFWRKSKPTPRKSSKKLMKHTKHSKRSQTYQNNSYLLQKSQHLYLVLRGMATVHFLYHLSLQFFWSDFDKTSKADTKPEELIQIITKDLLVQTSYSLFSRYLSIIGFRFGQVFIEHRGIKVDESLYDYALSGVSLHCGKEQA